MALPESYKGWEATLEMTPIYRDETPTPATGDGSNKNFTIDNNVGEWAVVYGDSNTYPVDMDSSSGTTIVTYDAPASDEAIRVDYTGDTPATVGKARSVSVEVTRSSETVYEIGSSDPACIKEGRKEITGSIEHMYVSDAFYDAIQPERPKTPSFTLKAKIGTTPDKTITLSGVKLESWSLDVPQDDYLVESVDYKATSCDLT